MPFTVTSKTGRVGLEGSSIGGKGRRPYGSESSFERLLGRLKAVPGVAQHKNTYPDIGLDLLVDEATFASFFSVMDEVVGQIRRANT